MTSAAPCGKNVPFEPLVGRTGPITLLPKRASACLRVGFTAYDA
jgi:hypothetical protein